MRCNVCGKEVEPGDRFCGHCRNLLAYNAEISRQHPSCLIFLIDHSASMEEVIAGGSGRKKKDAVADAVNRLLNDIVLRCAKEKGVYHYFDIGMWTYSGKNDILRVFSDDLVSIVDVEKQVKRIETRCQRVSDGVGEIFEQEVEFAVWLEPRARGETPMKAAFAAVLGPLQNWVSQHPESFPPTILNVTDGQYTSDSPAPVVKELMQMGTLDGNTLIFNCHISSQNKPEILFPGNMSAVQLQGPQRELYDFSSDLPALMTPLAQAKGYNIEPGSRGYIYNSKDVTLVDFLDIGTRATHERRTAA